MRNVTGIGPLPRENIEWVQNLTIVCLNPMKRPLEILSAEDHRMYAELVEAVFERAGHHVATAANGREAWELFQQEPARFDVVVTDHQMPEIDGAAFVALLRQSHFTGKIIVHAASLNSGLVERYRALSVDHIVSKGTGTDRLLPLAEGMFPA